MRDKILIFGEGFIGAKIKEHFNCPVSKKRIHALVDIDSEVGKYDPQVIINCIGFTGAKNVDGCEDNKDKTLQANTFIPLMFAEVALRRKIKLVHISSGCIFHFDYAKDKPIDEARKPDFFELFYSRSKIYADQGLMSLGDKANILIVRPRVPLDNRPNPRNILTKLVGFQRVIDVENSVTYLPDFVKALEHLIKIDAKGIYNTVNKGSLRYPAILEIYKKHVPDFSYRIVDAKDLNMVRTNLLLSIEKLEKSGFSMPDINEVTEGCVEGYLKY